jgi:hypothetical protein
MTDRLGQADIDAIVGDDTCAPDGMNNKITHAYHKLSQAVREELSAGPNLDWCGFAKWSSHTVGLDLNPADVGLRTQALSDLIAGALPSWSIGKQLIVELLRQLIDVEDHLVVRTLRLGNTTIFYEMGSVFLRLLDRLPERRAPKAQSDHDFAVEVVDQALAHGGKSVPPGLSLDLLMPPPSDPPTPPGPPTTDPLVSGIESYLRAAREPAARAELMLAGNMLFSEFEQARADRLIMIGICAPLRSKLIRAINSVLPNSIDLEQGLLAGAGQSNPLVEWVQTRWSQSSPTSRCASTSAARRFSSAIPSSCRHHRSPRPCPRSSRFSTRSPTMPPGGHRTGST